MKTKEIKSDGEDFRKKKLTRTKLYASRKRNLTFLLTVEVRKTIKASREYSCLTTQFKTNG